MSARKNKISPFFISVTAVLTVTAALCFFALAYGNDKIDFKTVFYFVCYKAEDNAVSADAVSGAVSNYGGAGYILEYGNTFYVTVACYYDEHDAGNVVSSLARRGLNCSVLEIRTDEYVIQSFGAGNRKQLYIDNLKTLYSLSELCYDCANSVDIGELDQTAAKNIISDVKSALNGLKYKNGENCFTEELDRLIAVCDSVSSDYIFSRDIRKLQIAICDTIINIRIY